MVVPDTLFVSQSALQLIDPIQDQPDGLSKSVAEDFIASSSQSVEGSSAAEVSISADDQIQAALDVDVGSHGKVLTVITDFKSPELDIPNELILDNILTNLSEISSVLYQVKSDQSANSFNIASIKENTMRDLKYLTTDVTALFRKFESLQKEEVTSSKLVISQDVLSQKMNFIHSSLSAKIEYVSTQLFSRITYLYVQCYPQFI